MQSLYSATLPTRKADLVEQIRMINKFENLVEMDKKNTLLTKIKYANVMQELVTQTVKLRPAKVAPRVKFVVDYFSPEELSKLFPIPPQCKIPVVPQEKFVALKPDIEAKYVNALNENKRLTGELKYAKRAIKHAEDVTREAQRRTANAQRDAAEAQRDAAEALADFEEVKQLAAIRLNHIESLETKLRLVNCMLNDIDIGCNSLANKIADVHKIADIHKTTDTHGH